MEKWKDYPENNNYQASNYGNIRRKAYIKKVNKVSKNGKKYITEMRLNAIPISKSLHQIRSKNGNCDYHGCTIGLVHRIVGKTWVVNPDNKPQINHIDGNGLNNHINNLEWATSGENQKHAYKLGLRTINTNINEKGQYIKG